jgi:hypothetical protein
MTRKWERRAAILRVLGLKSKSAFLTRAGERLEKTKPAVTKCGGGF